MNDFRLAEPHYVHALWLVIAVVALLFWLERRGGSALNRFLSPHMQSRLVRRSSATRRYLRIALLGLCGFFLIGALLRPQWGTEFVSTPRAGAEIMVCLDVSKSMLAEDVVPNRLDRAKSEIRDLLSYLDGDHVGLIAFAGRASVLCPLTPDFSFLRLVLDGAGPWSVTRGGTRLEEPIKKAVDGFGDTTDVSRAILLITDGEDHDSYPVEAAKWAGERGIKIIAIGFGDETGSEIMVTDPETGARTLLRDADGKAVHSRLDGDTLLKIGNATNGLYIPAGTGVLDLQSIYDTHISKLTRGRLDGRGRTVHKEGYQWAVLLALIALLASVAVGGGSRKLIPTALPSGGGRAAAAVIFSCALILAAFSSSAPAWAQQQPSPATVDSEAEPGSESPPELQIPEDPRQAHNRALSLLKSEALDSGLDDAERLFGHARREAGTDAELRFRSSYNLGWVDIKRADKAWQENPEEALTSLYRAADWFREAIRLRPESDEARHNLEIILRRALALADSLAQRDQKDLARRLDEIIQEQRALVAGARSIVERVAGLEDPNAVEEYRREFRALATEERKVLSSVEKLSNDVAQEKEAIEAKSEEERSPEERVRAVQLQVLLHYLHRSGERLGQARVQLRRKQGERAYRRTSAALSELKRARDQLRNPVQVLDAIIRDGSEVSRYTGALVALQGSLGNSEELNAPPPWLNLKYLQESQEGVSERTHELQLRLLAGLEENEASSQPEDEPGPEEDPQVAQQQAQLKRFLEQVREAEPFVTKGNENMLLAKEALQREELGKSTEKQWQGIQALLGARERFLDLKGLIETLYADERRIQGGLNAYKEELDPELLPALRDGQDKNIERSERLREQLARELVELP
ncbi:MAG: VWA domain-containing protein, partial [Planctomycetota bacterium]